MDDKLLHLCSPGRKEAHNQRAAEKKKNGYIETTLTLYINKSALGFGITEYKNVHSLRIYDKRHQPFSIKQLPGQNVTRVWLMHKFIKEIKGTEICYSR